MIPREHQEGIRYGRMPDEAKGGDGLLCARNWRESFAEWIRESTHDMRDDFKAREQAFKAGWELGRMRRDIGKTGPKAVA